MVEHNEKTIQNREETTEPTPPNTIGLCGVSMVVGVPTPKFLIVDVEIGGGFTHTRRQKPPKKTIPYYRLIRKLRERGYFFYQISNIFNQHNLKPNRTDKFSPQTIHGSFKKMKIREKEMSKREKPRIINMEYEY